MKNKDSEPINYKYSLNQLTTMGRAQLDSLTFAEVATVLVHRLKHEVELLERELVQQQLDDVAPVLVAHQVEQVRAHGTENDGALTQNNTHATGYIIKG